MAVCSDCKFWFKQRITNKIAIIANFAACVANLYCGCYWVAFLWLLLAVSWIIIDGYQVRLRRVCEIAEKNDVGMVQYVRSINLERAKVLYYICLYRKEKLISDFCKTDWQQKDTKKFLSELQMAETSVETLSKLLQEKLKEYDNDGKDNKTKAEGAE